MPVAPAADPRQIPRTLVAAPPAAPAAPYGLFSAATIAEGVDPHEFNGIEYETVCSTTVREWPPGCAVAAGGAPTSGYDRKQPDPTTGMSSADPFALYAAEDCVLGNTSDAGLARFRARFAAGEQAAVESVFFDGRLGNRPALSVGTPGGNQPVILNGGAEMPIPQALGLLEHWIACVSGGTGVIHAPRWTIESIAAAVTGGIFTAQGPQARTKSGSVFAFGTGYPGTAPANYTPAQDEKPATWLYATRPVQIRRSSVIEAGSWGPGTVDLDSNRGLRLIERMYVVDVPCNEVAAVRTNLPVLSPTPPAPARTTSQITEVSE